MFVLIATVLLLTIHQGQCWINATATLHPDNSPLNVGSLTFTQENADSPVRITGSVTGLNASSAHGFHIHANEIDEGLPSCAVAGPHFNPYNTVHGPPSANITSRHVGDLGNLTTDADGSIGIDMEDSIIQLYNATQSILNRAVVIHLLRDDGGQGGFDDSNTTGNAGARIICGLVKFSAEDPTTAPPATSTSTPATSTSTPATSTSTPATSTSGPATSTSGPATSTTEPPTTTSGPVTSTQNYTTTPGAGLNIQPAMFVLIITIIIGYVIRY